METPTPRTDATETRISDERIWVPLKDARELERELIESQAREVQLREVYDAACAFIDSHAADPDITAEMCRTYADFVEKRESLPKIP